MNDLVTSSNSTQIQAFPLSEGRVNIITGIFNTVIGVHCVLDGSFDITWPSGVVTIDCLSGDDFMFNGHSKIEVQTGIFHLV